MTVESGADKKESFRKMEEEQLNILTQYGIRFTGSVESAAEILHSEFLGETELSKDDKQRLFEILLAAVRDHRELINQSIKERQIFFYSVREDGNESTNLE